MEQDFIVAANLADFFQRLHSANLIVNMNDRADKSVRPDCRLENVKVHHAFGCDWQVCHLETFILELSARVKNTLMIHLSCYDVTLFVSIKTCKAFQAQVVRLSCSRCKDNFLCLSSDKSCNVLSGRLTGLFCFPTVLMGSGVGVAIALCEEGKHFIQNSDTKK